MVAIWLINWLIKLPITFKNMSIKFNKLISYIVKLKGYVHNKG